MHVNSEGFRLNVGIVLTNGKSVLLGQRVQQDSWQFPQGGLRVNESPIDGMYRELAEEVGLNRTDVKVLAESKGWFSYLLPKQFIRINKEPKVIGQKQKWFLVELLVDDSNIKLDTTAYPEFINWQWVDYWYPIEQVIYFKKQVYLDVLTEFENKFREK